MAKENSAKGPSRSEVMRFALNIIERTPLFIDFAAALYEYVGRGVRLGDVKAYYTAAVAFPHQGETLEFDSDDTVAQVTDAAVREHIVEEEIQRQAKSFRQNDSQLLMRLVTSYREPDTFQRMRNFVASNRNVTGYNLYLVALQRPGAQFVGRALWWLKEFNRKPKPTAQPIIVLRPTSRGSTEVIFELGDTEPLDEGLDDENVKAQLAEQAKALLYGPAEDPANGPFWQKAWQHLTNNLPKLGIRLDLDFKAGPQYSGLLVEEQTPIRIPFRKDFSFDYYLSYVLRVNSAFSRSKQLLTIFHELAHLLCHHLDSYFYSHKSRVAEEFEAETVAWILAHRLGLPNDSDAYLAGYVRDGKLPEIDIERVVHVVDYIETMLNKQLPPMTSMKSFALRNDVSLWESVDIFTSYIDEGWWCPEGVRLPDGEVKFIERPLGPKALVEEDRNWAYAADTARREEDKHNHRKRKEIFPWFSHDMGDLALGGAANEV